MIKKIDCHMHSNCSDGELSPAKLMQKCSEQEIDCVVLTDHDTVDGVKEAMIVCQKLNIGFFVGVELSSVYNGRGFHILGLGVDYQNEVLLDSLNHSRNLRLERAEKIISELERYGWKVNSSIFNKADGVATRMEIVEAVKNKEMSADEFFDKWLGKNCLCFVEMERITVKKAIEIIHEAGGIAVLAHPVKTMEKDLKFLPQIVKEFKVLGLDGLETFYPEYNGIQTKIVYDLTIEYELIPTAGSDFHRLNSLRELGKHNFYGLKFDPEKIIDSLSNRG
ncbi:MAG: PHP domain-containing protein [Patescibacteria group bacterium]|nr:PHP domain-containing protein [Patescibacteria group bacterium]